MMATTTTTARDAICAWRDLLGPAHVLTGEQTLALAATATYPTTARAVAILRPGTRDEIRDCIRIAARNGQVLHPVSTGRNWGYGSRVPPVDGAALLDLGRLDRILDFDPELGYLTVEPGVTFRQALAFLRAQGDGWTLGVTGGPLTGSLIGNLAERGLGFGTQVDRWEHAADLEVLLGDGTTIHTGYGAWPGAVAAPVGRRGPGPDLAGLFSQSGWGIITRATFWLQPLPSHGAVGWLMLDESSRFPQLVDAVRRLQLTCPNVTLVRFLNDAKMLAARRLCPPDLVDSDGYLSPDRRVALRRAARIGAWQASVGIEATSAAQLALLREEIGTALTDKGLHCSWADARPAVDPGLRDWADAQDLDGALASAYWKKPDGPGTRPDLDRDDCGVLWGSAALPFTGSHAAQVVAIAEQTCAMHRFEPTLSLSAVSSRLLVGTVALTWDRAVSGSDGRALECHRALLRRLAEAGYYPYRLGRGSAAHLPPPDPAMVALWHRLAAACDPAGALAHQPLAGA